MSTCSRDLGISKSKLINYFDNLRACYLDALVADPIVFNSHGPFEVDEVQIKHVKTGSGVYVNLWILDILERETGLYWATIIPNRSAEVLIGHIQAMIPPGAIIFSDDWASYSSLTKRFFKHHTVTHSTGEYSRQGTIEGKEIDVHINTLEGLHRALRQAFANKSSRDIERIELILGEFIYRHSGRPLFNPFKIN